MWNVQQTIILVAALIGKLVDKCSEIKSAACRASHIAQGGRTPMYLTILCNAQHKAQCLGAKENPSFKCQYVWNIMKPLITEHNAGIMTLIALAEFFVPPHKVEGLVSCVMCSACSQESGDMLPPADQGQKCSRRGILTRPPSYPHFYSV